MFRSSAGSDPARVLPVLDSSQVGEVRRLVKALVATAGFDETATERVAIVVTELATNLLKHAGGGRLVVQRAAAPSGAVDILALDSGPGIANLPQALRDGYSTAGSPGTGLGAIRRIAAAFDIHSKVGQGTAVLARLCPTPRSRPAADEALQVRALTVAYPNEEVCGDAWGVHQLPGRTVIMLVDGLGHGVIAAEAAAEAVRVFRERPLLRPQSMVEAMHGALRGTRGAAVAVTEIDHAREIVRFAGVGNIRASIAGPTTTRHLVSHSGIVGHTVRRIDEFTYPWSAEATLVAHSDGLTSRSEVTGYSGFETRDLALVGGLLYRDFCRGADDVVVLVARAARR